jgi:hypothetical protein
MHGTSSLYIPKLSQNLAFDCASILIFAAACIGHVLEHGLLPHRLACCKSEALAVSKTKF